MVRNVYLMLPLQVLHNCLTMLSFRIMRYVLGTQPHKKLRGLVRWDVAQRCKSPAMILFFRKEVLGTGEREVPDHEGVEYQGGDPRDKAKDRDESFVDLHYMSISASTGGNRHIRSFFSRSDSELGTPVF